MPATLTGNVFILLCRAIGQAAPTTSILAMRESFASAILFQDRHEMIKSNDGCFRNRAEPPTFLSGNEWPMPFSCIIGNGSLIAPGASRPRFEKGVLLANWSATVSTIGAGTDSGITGTGCRQEQWQRHIFSQNTGGSISSLQHPLLFASKRREAPFIHSP